MISLLPNSESILIKLLSNTCEKVISNSISNDEKKRIGYNFNDLSPLLKCSCELFKNLPIIHI